MTTTLEIPDEVLKETMLLTKAATESDAILAALREYNQRHRQSELIKFLGTFEDFMSPEDLIEMRKDRLDRDEAD